MPRRVLRMSAMLLAVAAPRRRRASPVDLRVVTNEPGELADVRQYAPRRCDGQDVAGDDCFDPTPPVKQSSGQVYPQAAPDDAERRLARRPRRSRAAARAGLRRRLRSFGALASARSAAKTPPGFFFLKSNHVALTVGARPVTVGRRRGAAGLPHAVGLHAPTGAVADAPRAGRAPGVPIAVQVLVHDEMARSEPAAGATVTGGAAPAATDADGDATRHASAPPATLPARRDGGLQRHPERSGSASASRPISRSCPRGAAARSSAATSRRHRRDAGAGHHRAARRRRTDQGPRRRRP